MHQSQLKKEWGKKHKTDIYMSVCMYCRANTNVAKKHFDLNPEILSY